MKKILASFVIFFLLHSAVSAAENCFWYNPYGGNYLSYYCPTSDKPYPDNMLWPPELSQYIPDNSYQPTVEYEQTGSSTASTYDPTVNYPGSEPYTPGFSQYNQNQSQYNQSQYQPNYQYNQINDCNRNPGRYVYWKKTQAIYSGNGKQLGAVMVQRDGNELKVDYEITSYRCKLVNTRLDVAESENSLPRSWSDFNDYHRLSGYQTTDSYRLDVRNTPPDQKLYIATLSRVVCDPYSSGSIQDVRVYNAYAGERDWPAFPGGKYITYKAVSADNPPVGTK